MTDPTKPHKFERHPAQFVWQNVCKCGSMEKSPIHHEQVHCHNCYFPPNLPGTCSCSCHGMMHKEYEEPKQSLEPSLPATDWKNKAIKRYEDYADVHSETTFVALMRALQTAENEMNFVRAQAYEEGKAAGRAEERERMDEMLISSLPPDAENLSTLTGLQAQHVIREFLKKTQPKDL